MELLKIQPFQETLHKGYCGPAVLKMVLQYYGVEKAEKELARLCGVSKNAGTDSKIMIKVLQKFGLRPMFKNKASFMDIQKSLDRKVPVIVDWFTRGRKDYPDSAVADGHYSVVVGLDREYIYLQDPEIGRLRKLKKHDFLKVWFDYSGEYLKSERQMIIRQMITVNL